MILNNVNKVLDKAEMPFILFWEFMLIIRMVSLYSVIPSIFDSLIFGIIAIVGGCLLARNGILWILKKKKLDLLLIIFTLAMLISSLVSGTGLLSNIKIIFWQMLFFFVVYEMSSKKNTKLFEWFEKILVGLWFLLVTISLGMFLVRFSYTMPLDKLYYGVRLGFIENRLYGVFVDPNYAATISMISLLFSIHLYFQTNHKVFKSFLIVSSLFQYFYIVLSGSRTAQIELFAVIVISGFFLTFYFRKSNSLLKRTLHSTIIAFVLFLISMFLFVGTQKASVVLINSIDQHTIIKKHSTHEKELSLQRKDVGEDADISNSRFKLWNSAFEIFESKKLLGTSPKNMFSYAKENLPQTWIAQKEQTPHNFFFYLLATTGLLGTIPFTLFLVIKIVQTLINLWKLKIKHYTRYLYWANIALVVLISACLITDIVLVNKLGAMVFFLYLGRLTYNNLENQEMSESVNEKIN
ncbi:O-antigen ligase family protein [Enterococcus thailandicus]|uniref:O-antigen ligase family protein n=1 Tax=Enterococcus TaxID=1350 RepID=UPI0032E4282F